MEQKKIEQLLHARIDQTLQKHEIDRGNYFGFQLQGPGICMLMHKANIVFQDIKDQV